MAITGVTWMINAPRPYPRLPGPPGLIGNEDQPNGGNGTKPEAELPDTILDLGID
jgi:hypothetical protein